MRKNNTNKSIKTITFTVTLNGNGGVNWEGSNGNKEAFIQSCKDAGIDPNVTGKFVKNIKWHKANYYRKDGKLVRKLKISADCIRHQMAGVKNSTITINDAIWAAYLASQEALCRGYLFPVENDITIIRKSPISVTDAEETSGAIPMVESKSASGVRNDTSYFQQETFGNTVWEFEVTVNLSELQFIPVSDIYSRRAVPRKLENIVLKNLKSAYGDVTTGYFAMKNASVDTPEYGFMLPDSAVRELVKWYADTVKNIDIRKATGYATFASMKVSALDDNNEVIKDFDLDSDYGVCSQYVEGDKAKYELAKSEVERQIAESNKKAKDAKKAEERAAKKAAKEAEAAK